MDLAEYGALAAYWEGQIDTGELCLMLKPLTAQQTMPLHLSAWGMIVPITQRGSL
jgi:hypothetical protein